MSSDNRVTQIKTPTTTAMPPCRSRSASVARRASTSRKPATSPRPVWKPAHVLKEFQVADRRAREFKAGDSVGVDTFKVGQLVDVTGTTRARASPASSSATTSASNRATHGNSRSHNTPGSIGWRRTRAACSRASGWRAILATYAHGRPEGRSRRQRARTAARQGRRTRRRRRRHRRPRGNAGEEGKPRVKKAAAERRPPKPGQNRQG